MSLDNNNIIKLVLGITVGYLRASLLDFHTGWASSKKKAHTPPKTADPQHHLTPDAQQDNQIFVNVFMVNRQVLIVTNTVTHVVKQQGRLKDWHTVSCAVFSQVQDVHI
jgi:hypothetical protein